MPNSSTRRYRPQMELLETRLTPAGNISAVMRNTTLMITGDNRDNAIMITQSTLGTITISRTDGTTTINGRPSATFSRVNGIQASMLNGQDVVQIGSDKGQSLILPGVLQVTGGSGGKSIQALADLFIGKDLVVTTNGGNDTIEFGGTVYVHGNATVNAGRGDNTVIFVPTGGTNTVVGSLNISNARGSSTTAVFDTSVLGNLTMTNAGNTAASGGTSDIFFGVSSADVKSAVLGSAMLHLGEGAGNISLTDTNVAKDLIITAAAFAPGTAPAINIAVGSLVNDSDSGVAGNLTVNAGAPVFLQLGTQEGGVARVLEVGGVTSLRTGDGDDSISMNGLVSRLDTVVNTFGGADQVSMDDSQFFGALRLGMGAGDDTFLLEGRDGTSRGTQFLKNVSVNLGDDDDSILVGALGDATRSVVSFFGPTRFDGGSGTNTRLNSSANLTTGEGDNDPFVNF